MVGGVLIVDTVEIHVCVLQPEAQVLILRKVLRKLVHRVCDPVVAVLFVALADKTLSGERCGVQPLFVAGKPVQPGKRECRLAVVVHGSELILRRQRGEVQHMEEASVALVEQLHNAVSKLLTELSVPL